MISWWKILALVIVAVPCLAQPNPDTLWTRSVGGASNEIGNSICAAADGNYVVAGYTQSFGADDIYLVKLNPSGDTLWTRVIDMGNIEHANSILPVAGGNLILGGSIQYLDGGNTSMLLVKTNSNGDTLWTHAFGRSFTDIAYAVQQTSDGGFILAGTTITDAGNEDAYLVRTNSTGDTVWTRTCGAAQNDELHSVLPTADGGCMAVGYSYSTSQATSGLSVKTDAAGNLLWQRSYTNTYYKSCASVQNAADGGYMIEGTVVPTPQTPPHLGSYLMKTDSAGNELWTHGHSIYPIDEFAFAANQTSDGGFILVGAIGNIDSAVYGMQLIRMDETGNTLWTRLYGAGTYAQGESVLETSDHGYVAAGVTQPGGNANLYVVRSGAEDMNLTYPNGGEVLGIGDTTNILWTGAVYGGNVALEFNRSYPSATWETIIESTINIGHFSWTVPGPESSQVRFRIRHLTIPTLTDTSDADLSFRNPQLHLVWPNGGETVLSGVRDTVRFERILVPGGLYLQLNRDYPTGDWQRVVTNIGGDSSALWIVMLPGGDHCRMRLVSLSDTTLFDMSDADFVLRAPQMTLTAPNGGEHLTVGSPFNITWSAPEHQGNIHITLNRDYPTGTWENVVNSTSNSGSYSWTPTAPASNNCRIRVATVYDPQARVESAADFSITGESVSERPDIPDVFILYPAYPNPFNAQATLAFSVPSSSKVSIAVFDLSGRRVKVLTAHVYERGQHRIVFDGSALPSGIYFVRVQAGEINAIQKIALLK